GAAHERPARPFAQHHRLAALLAHVLGRLARQLRLALGVDVHGRLALGITRTAQERPAPAHPLQHRLAAVGAGMLGRLGLLARLVLLAGDGAALLDVIALRIPRAAEELAEAAEALLQRLAAQ